MKRITGLDKEIKDLVIVLNRAGFVTYYSCAGHSANGRFGRVEKGCIQVSRVSRCQREALRAACQWRGLKGIKIRDIKVSPYGQEQGITEGTQVTFEPIGLTLEQRLAQLNHKRIPRV